MSVAFIQNDLALPSRLPQKRRLNRIPFILVSVVVDGFGKSIFSLFLQPHSLFHGTRANQRIFFNKQMLTRQWTANFFIDKLRILPNLLIVDFIIIRIILFLLLHIFLHQQPVVNIPQLMLNL